MAGGGSLVSFPILTLGAGIPSIPANATNAVALWPGSIAGALAGRDHFAKMRPLLLSMLGPTAAGSVAGALLLSLSSQRLFDVLIPVLILLAALLLFFQPQIRARSQRRGRPAPAWARHLAQTLIAVYGGYFGAGIGIMMLGAFSAMLDEDFHEINVLKNVLAVVVNIAATVVFVVQGLVLWIPMLSMAAGAAIGAYAMGRVAQRIDGNVLRLVISLYGFGMAAYFGWRALGG